MNRLVPAAAGSIVVLAATAAAAAEGAPHIDGKALSLVWAIPFAGILLSIAIMPLAVPQFWHHHFGKVSAAWAIAFLVPAVLAFGVPAAVYELLHTMLLEYIPFIVLLWALFTVLARRWRVDPLRATAMVWVTALAYVPVYGAIAGGRLAAAPRGEVIFQAIYQGLGVAVGALTLYAWAIRVLGASIASLFMPLIPIFGVLLGVPVLGEIPSAVQWAGIAAVSAGMALAALRHAP